MGEHRPGNVHQRHTRREHGPRGAVSGHGLRSFAPVTAGATLDGIPAAQLSIVNGTAVAVWEVLKTATTSQETFDFPIWMTYSAAAAGNVLVTGGFAPVSTQTLPDTNSPTPRFTVQTDRFTCSISLLL